MRSPLLFALLLLPCCGSPDDSVDVCQPPDADGIVGGDRVFVVTVDDEAFDPVNLTAQNRANVTLKLTNAGTTPHGFRIECLETPNDDGCQSEWCFPDSARIPPIDPGETATATFQVPLFEGEYPINTGVDGDSAAAQFNVE